MQERTPEGGTGVSWSETASRHTRLREDEGFQLSVRFRIIRALTLQICVVAIRCK
jgi:hypothetical protein